MFDRLAAAEPLAFGHPLVGVRQLEDAGAGEVVMTAADGVVHVLCVGRVADPAGGEEHLTKLLFAKMAKGAPVRIVWARVLADDLEAILWLVVPPRALEAVVVSDVVAVLLVELVVGHRCERLAPEDERLVHRKANALREPGARERCVFEVHGNADLQEEGELLPSAVLQVPVPPQRRP